MVPHACVRTAIRKMKGKALISSSFRLMKSLNNIVLFVWQPRGGNRVVAPSNSPLQRMYRRYIFVETLFFSSDDACFIFLIP